MPAIFAAIPIILGEIGAAVTFGVAAGAVAVEIGTAVVLTAASIGLGFVERALLGRPKIPSIGGQQNQQITTRQAIAPWPVFYGRNGRTGGILTYMSVTGTNGEFLNLVITLAGHQLHSIDEMFFDGAQVADATGVITAAKFVGFITILQKNLGTASQPAFPGLVAADANWASTSKQSGRAGVYVQLKYSADVYPNSIPNITFATKGREMFDPRSSTTAYSENPALCIRDYLLGGDAGAVFGLGCTTGELNDASFIAAANNCEEIVNLKSGGTLPGGHNYRYLCNGSFTTDQKPADILNQLLSSMAGYLTWENGKWSVYAGVWRGPATVTLTDDDLRASVKVQILASKSSLMNQVKGAIINSTQAWQPADFAPYAEDTLHGFGSDQWLTQDNGERIISQIQLPFTVDSSMAQRLAKVLLERTRRQIRATWPCKLTAYRLQPADIVNVTRSRFGWSAKTFEVQQCILSLEPDSEGVAVPAVDLALAETDANVYAWDPLTEELPDPSPGVVTLPTPIVVGAPSGLSLGTVQTTRADGIRASYIQATWTSPTDQMVLSGGKIVVQYRTHGTSQWLTADIVAGDAVTCNVDNVSEGSAYDIRIYSTNTSGAASATVEIDNFTVAVSASNYSYRPLSNPLTSTDAGASDTITVAAFTMRVGGNDVSISSGSVTSLSRKTLYYIYYSDPTIAGGSVSFSATTTKETALLSAGRFLVGSILTPAAGGVGTVGNNDGGTGAQLGNLWILSPQLCNDTFVPTSGFVPIGTSGTGNVEADGDTSTFLTRGSVGDLTIASFPAFNLSWKSLTLKVLTSLTNAGSGGSVTVSYSVDGGTTFTTIWTAGSLVGRALTTDSISLALTQNANLVQVKFSVATVPANTFRVYEAWIEGQV
jgi:hypothetical protein